MHPLSRSWMLRAACVSLALGCLVGCGTSVPLSIAVIPRTSGTILWEPEDVGAQMAASELGERIYWNASTREDDIDGQIALVERMRPGRYRGLVLAPDHALALITPVRRALASGLPIVIVGSPLSIPANQNLSYVLNDEEEGGRLAARRVAAILHRQGKIALIGINPDITGIVARADSFERNLAAFSPRVEIVVRRLGTFNYAHEQEAAEKVLRDHPDLNVIVALTSTSTRGAISTIENNPGKQSVKVIGFDPESLPFEDACLDSMIVQNTRGMGDRAVRLIHARLRGESLPARVDFQPILVTRDNVGSAALREMLYARWRPGNADLKRSVTP
jgi:ribose transport system substrate-binding protein